MSQRNGATRRGGAHPEIRTEVLQTGFRWIALARELDDTMWRLVRQGKGHFAVPCSGHEAVGAAAGMAADLTADYLAAHYRDLSACVAWGLSARDLMAHYYGRAADPCTGGRQPYAHWGSRARRIMVQAGPQPNVVTHAVGSAYAARLLGECAVTWVSFGDGGAQKGEVHEAMNFAAIHKLPVVFCVETNGYTQSVPIRLESSVTDISLRAQGYGMPGVSVDGMDLLTMFAAAKEAVDRARAGDGPSLVEARVYRFLPNTSNDDDRRYRPRAEVEAALSRDPLLLAREALLARGVTAAGLEQVEAEVKAEVAEATAWAEAQPVGAPESALLETWANHPVEAPAW